MPGSSYESKPKSRFSQNNHRCDSLLWQYFLKILLLYYIKGNCGSYRYHCNYQQIIIIVFDINHKWISTWEFCVFWFSGTFLYVALPDSSYMRPCIRGFWGEKNWILDNGTPLVYTLWAIGQPKINTDKRYIKFVEGKWKTTISSAIKYVFCIYNVFV